MNIKYHNRIITLLTIAVILYSFYYYNKDNSSANRGYIEDETSSGGAKYNLILDPERTDLTWYEKLIINHAKKKQEHDDTKSHIKTDK